MMEGGGGGEEVSRWRGKQGNGRGSGSEQSTSTRCSLDAPLCCLSPPSALSLLHLLYPPFSPFCIKVTVSPRENNKTSNVFFLKVSPYSMFLSLALHPTLQAKA